MPIKIYTYAACSTCKNALKFLDQNKIAYKNIPIVEQPPSTAELRKMLKWMGNLKSLFNTSGVQYRELGISQKLKDGLSEAEALKLLGENGKLIKRPFLVSEDGGMVGFKIDAWKKFFKK